MNNNGINNPGSDAAGVFKRIVILIAAIFYFISPVDIVPDFIPILGWVDDLVVALFAGRQLVKK